MSSTRPLYLRLWKDRGSAAIRRSDVEGQNRTSCGTRPLHRALAVTRGRTIQGLQALSGCCSSSAACRCDRTVNWPGAAHCCASGGEPRRILTLTQPFRIAYGFWMSPLRTLSRCIIFQVSRIVGVCRGRTTALFGNSDISRQSRVPACFTRTCTRKRGYAGE
jgi:hypothetical protein